MAMTIMQAPPSGYAVPLFRGNPDGRPSPVGRKLFGEVHACKQGTDGMCSPYPLHRRAGDGPPERADLVKMENAMAPRPLVTLALATAVALASSFTLRAQTTLTPAQLAERTIERRAVEAVIWGMPAVNYDLMLQEMLNKTGGKVNQVLYWGRPLDWHNQTLTPNPDAIYLMAFFNTKDAGPIVIEVPPAGDDGSLNANIVNIWQMPLEDAGPSGADAGKGGKYLILPPGYRGSHSRRLYRAAARHATAAMRCCART